MKYSKGFLLIISVLCLVDAATAIENVYWLRGSDATTYVEGSTHYVMSSTPPSLSSTKTDLSLTTESGKHEIVRWYTTSFPQTFLITGDVYFWFKRMRITGDSATYRWSLYDYDPSEGKNTLIRQSNWLSIPNNTEKETKVMLEASYAIAAGHRIMLLLEYNAKGGNGQLEFVVDEPKEGLTTVWDAPNNQEYQLRNVDRAAALLINLCSSIACNSDADCDDNDVTTADSCTNPGGCDAFCSHERCDVECLSDVHCDDGKLITLDMCVGKGTCNAYCTNTICDIACNSDADCDDGKATTEEACINGGTCLSYCQYEYCEPACIANEDCDDGNPVTLDVCAGAGRCSAVCSNLLNCGNGVCEEGETECNCSADCGNCSGEDNCRQSICLGMECSESLLPDCCGNGICEYGEEKSCSADCDSAISITLLGILEGEYFLRGDKILIKARVKRDLVSITDADVVAKGFFGELKLYNDGLHDDDAAGDSVYANSVSVAKETRQSVYPIIIEATYGGESASIVKRYVIIPNIEIELNTDKEQYKVGDYVKVSGYVRKRNYPISEYVTISIIVDGDSVFARKIKSGADGIFSLTYRSNLLYPVGIWTVRAEATDISENYGIQEKELLFSAPVVESLLQLEFVEQLNNTYYRGETVYASVSVSDDAGNPVRDATVTTVTPGGELIKLEEKEAGVYEASFSLRWDEPVGEQNLDIKCLKIDENTTYGGNKAAAITILPIEYNIELLEPAQRRFMIGEEINFRIKLNYPNGEPVINSNTYAKIGEKVVPLVRKEEATYVGTHVVEDDEYGNIIFQVNSLDQYDNNASLKVVFDVDGVALEYYLIKYSLTITAWTLAFIISAGIVAFIVWKKKRREIIKKQEAKLLGEIKEIQRRYFKEGTLDRSVYDKLITKYEAQLKKTRGKLKKVEEVNK